MIVCAASEYVMSSACATELPVSSAMVERALPEATKSPLLWSIVSVSARTAVSPCHIVALPV